MAPAHGTDHEDAGAAVTGGCPLPVECVGGLSRRPWPAHASAARAGANDSKWKLVPALLHQVATWKSGGDVGVPRESLVQGYQPELTKFTVTDVDNIPNRRGTPPCVGGRLKFDQATAAFCRKHLISPRLVYFAYERFKAGLLMEKALGTLSCCPQRTLPTPVLTPRAAKGAEELPVRAGGMDLEVILPSFTRKFFAPAAKPPNQ